MEHSKPNDGPEISFGVDTSSGRDHSAIVICERHGDVAVCRPATCEEFAKAYVDCLYSEPNAWGQHVMEGFGQSHHVMLLGAEHFGNERFQAAISKELSVRTIEKKLENSQ